MLPSVALWFGAVASAVPVDEVPNPRDAGGWVTDLADVLDPGAQRALNDRIEALHRDLDVEIAVVTVPSATTPDGMTEVPKHFATALFERWGVGDAEVDNGLLVLLVLDARRLEMETGYGLEAVLPDGWLGGMQADHMVPRLRDGDYDGALDAGLAEVDARLRAHPEDVRLGAAGPLALQEQASRRLTRGLGVGGGLAGLGTLVGLGLVTARVRRRQRTCESCDLYMPMLGEAEDDAHLEPGQRTEEQIGSVDHQVHQCPRCGLVRSFARSRWFSGYSACGRCGHRTRSTTTTTLVAATEHHGGRIRVTEHCVHCGHRASYERSTARLSPPSRSSSSGGGSFRGGGGSFGGGRSGGGGAGSSW